MRQRKPASSYNTGAVKAAEWRNTYARLQSYVTDGILVKVATTLKDFEACQYVACTDSLRVIVLCNSGAVAAFSWGEFIKWSPSVPAAVDILKVPRLPSHALR